MKTPLISVVMAVFNNQNTLKRTIQSILQQQNVSLEFIIVNDGSSDNSEEILSAMANKDHRIKCISQSNQGLTRALINGCSQAQGKYIARQDAGDISLSGRLEQQLKVLDQHEDVTMVSAATQFVSPEGHLLYTTVQNNEDANNGLKQTRPELIIGPPHHGSVMFRKQTYELVGGYRHQYVVAQDIDLWTRMIEKGSHRSLPANLYRATVEQNSISMLRREQQLHMLTYICACSQSRAETGSDQYILDTIEPINRLSNPSKISDAAYFYFLGSNLIPNNPKASANYLKQAIKLNPLSWKALVKLLYSYYLRSVQILLKPNN